jgi:uncharacterized membrane protein
MEQQYDITELILYSPPMGIYNTTRESINNYLNRVTNLENNVRRVLFPEQTTIEETKKTEKLNAYLDLSNLIFDIREKITSKEYKDIMDAMNHLKNL